MATLNKKRRCISVSSDCSIKLQYIVRSIDNGRQFFKRFITTVPLDIYLRSHISGVSMKGFRL